MSDYRSYSPSKAYAQAYYTKTPPKYIDHRDATYNTTFSPYQTPNRDAYSRGGDETDYSESTSANKARQDIELREIKNALDTQFSQEIDQWKLKWNESESRRNFLENENQKLLKEINFWKGKKDSSEADKPQKQSQPQQSKNNQYYSPSRTAADIKYQNLVDEVESLREVLASKILDCNEIKANYSKLQLWYAEHAEKDEIAQEYEQRIERLKNEYSDRILEVDDLKKQRARLELEQMELQKVQKEQDSLKHLLEAKSDENSRLRREKTEAEVENYKQKKVENALLEKEALLKSQVENLETDAVNAEELRKSTFLQKSMVHSNIHDEMRKSYHAEQNQFEEEVEEQEKIANKKTHDHDELRKSFHQQTNELSKAEEDQQAADTEVEAWKEKAAEAEKLKEAEVLRASRFKENTIKMTLAEQLKEKQQLEDKIAALNKVIDHKEQDLNKVYDDVNLTEAEKKQLEEERIKLQLQIDDLLKKQEENNRNFQLQLQVKDDINSKSVDKARKEYDNENRRINNQIQALRNVIDSKREEAERARHEANDLCIRLVNCENKARAAETESLYWKQQTDKIAQQKALECQVEKDITQAQLRDLERQQSIEKIVRQKESDNIRSIIDHKEKEAQSLRLTQSRAASDLARERYEKIKNQTEAEINRARTLEAERAKFTDMAVRDHIHHDQVEALRRSGHVEGHVLRSEVNHLHDQLIRKDIEARDWKDNYARLSTSPYRKY